MVVESEPRRRSGSSSALGPPEGFQTLDPDEKDCDAIEEGVTAFSKAITKTITKILQYVRRRSPICKRKRLLGSDE